MPTSAAPAVLQSRAGHPSSAGIIADARTRAWPPVRAGADEDTERDFGARRRRSMHSGRCSALERVAAFLVAISRNNTYEGRDPCAIPDTLTCGFVAELLGLSIASLAHLLVGLEERDLIVALPSSGLRVLDLAGLERLAEAA
jgi:CRP/FNR family transcriptional regulator